MKRYEVILFHKQLFLSFCDFWSDTGEILLSHKSYYVRIDCLSSSLTSDGIVIDFGLCKQEIKKVIIRLKGKIVLASRDLRLNFTNDGSQYSVSMENGLFYSFPKENCFFFDSEDTSPESISKLLTSEINQSIRVEEEVAGFIRFSVKLVSEYEVEEIRFN